MSFQPIIPGGGYAGWVYLKNTLVQQQEASRSTPAQQRDEAYFREKITKVTSSQDLVSDPRLLRITLTAFGLEADVNSKAFITKVLSEDIGEKAALANRLADKRYLTMAATLGLGKGQVVQTGTDGFADRILTAYRTRTFEAQVGTQNGAMRLALNAERELLALAAGTGTEDAKWFTIMGNKPLRAVMETALGLPSSIGRLDIDQQLNIFKSKAQSAFGTATVSQFTDEERMQKLIRTYLIRDQIASGGQTSSPASAALQLLTR